MSGYSPHTDKDRKEFLSSIGAPDVESLFQDVPKKARLKGEASLPPPLSEEALMREITKLSGKNLNLDDAVSFLGGGAYNHFVPSVVRHILGRSEFYTAYTPYQAEASQGTLQAIYEYQSLVCGLTGMDAANASMYDGATALAEAASLACQATKRKEILVSAAVHPSYRDVLKTYGKAASWTIKEIPFDGSGKTDVSLLLKETTEKTAAVLLSQPNFFGCFEETNSLSDGVRSKGALFIVSVDPVSLGILSPPGQYGADIVTGEGQGAGNAVSFGGPLLGIFAIKEKYLRLMPGRLSGKTKDQNGRRGFVMTLQTREQHIRRERATSNICSNEALNALASTVYLAALGRQGLKKVAELCLHKANYLKKELSSLRGIEVPFPSRTFKEFAIKTNEPPGKINKRLLKENIIGGLALEELYPELKNHMLLSVTELTKKKDMDRLIKALK